MTSTILTDDSEESGIVIRGDMQGSWARPFGVDWLTLDTVGVRIMADATGVGAALESSFELGAKRIAVEIGITGSGTNRLVHISGNVDALSLSDFTQLVRKHVGAAAEPFGDTTLDFTFADVVMTLETGARTSFSVGGKTTLKGKAADVLFSATYLPGGGAPRLLTGIRMQDWSLADALDEVKGTFVEDFRMESVALVLSKGDGTTSSSEMAPKEREFYGKIYGTGDFAFGYRSGLSLIGVVPMAGNPLSHGLDALGMSTDAVFLSGTVPGSILGLGGGSGGLGGLSLIAALPPVSPPGAPEWFVAGQLGLEITAQPSVGFIGEITVRIDDDVLTFSVGAAIQRVRASVEFALTGALKSQEPWAEPFGIEWLVFNNAAVKVAVNVAGSITLGFAGDMVIGDKDVDVSVAVTVSPSGVPTNFIFDGASNEGVSMADLVALQQRMARGSDPNALSIPLNAMPEMAVRSLHLKFAPRGDPDLGVTAGFAIKGDLWIPSEAGGPPDRDFVGVDLSVDISGIQAAGHLGAFVLGPITWDDAQVDLTLNLPVQRLVVRGDTIVGSFFEGDVNLEMTRNHLDFTTSTEIYGQFQALLNASASFSLNAPEFTVLAALGTDFNEAIALDLVQRLTDRAKGSTAVAHALLDRGLSGWGDFRANPNRLNFSSRVSDFASAAGWPSGEWKAYVDAVQDAMNDIDTASPTTPPNLLDLALDGLSIPGVPGVKTRVCVRRRLVPPFDCLEYQDRCNGLAYDGGPCWTVAPRNIGGACHDPSLSQYNLPCSATPFVNQMLVPPLISRIETILVHENRSPMTAIEHAEFTGDLAVLKNAPAVTLATRLQFMREAAPMNLSTHWDFRDRAASLDTLRDAVLEAL